MLVHVREVLTAGELAEIRRRLSTARWVDGRETSGMQSGRVKNNEQLPYDAPELPHLQQLVTAALQRHATFFSAALPKRILPPMFNRYTGSSNAFGDHVDGAIRYLPGSAGVRVRSDLSCTLFLSEPTAYEGGELCVAESFGDRSFKLAAGDLLIYSATSVHRVEPVTRGARLAAFFWIESMVRSDEQRRLLFGMDRHLMQLRSSVGESDASIIGLTGTYHNLLRLWADT